MIDDILPPLNAEVCYEMQMNTTSVASRLKSAAIISALAASILTSAYLFYTNPSKWMLATASVMVINLYTLPKILRYGNETVIKFALAANLVALSSLSIGGIGTANIHLSQWLWASLKAYDFGEALVSSFLVTGMMGYGVPLFRETLEKAYRFLHDPDFQKCLTSLREQFHGRPEVGLGFMQGCLWESFILHLALFQPQFLINFCQYFDITLPNYAWPMAATASEKIDIEQFDHLLVDMENMSDAVNLQGYPLSDDIRASSLLNLKFALQSLKSADLPVAISKLLSRGAKLIPNIISNEQFVKLFTEDALTATNESIQKFLELIETWENLSNKHYALNGKIKQLEQDIQNSNMQQLTPKEEENLHQRYEELHQQFTELRIKIEKIYFNKRIWQGFAPIWNKEDGLLFERSEEILNILHDQDLLKEIDDIYRTMVGTGQGAHRTVIDRLQHIKNKLATLHGDEEGDEVVSAIMHLAANQAFIQKDFEDLQKWLKLDSPHDLEDALAAIGLATKENLYDNAILPRQGQLSKADIRKNLRRFIKKAPSPRLADRVQPKDGMDQATPAYTISEKVSRFMFYAITSGLVMVPILIHPYMGGTGFALGICFFILKRFDVPGTQAIADFSYELLRSLTLGEIVYGMLRNRRILSFSPQHREASNRFVNADFFARMRVISLQILGSLLISYFPVHNSSTEIGIGSFLQGVAIADEVISLV
jgi:TolA-binding protein